MKFVTGWWIASLLVAACDANAAPPPLPKARLDAWFDSLEKRELANCAVAISESGELRYERFVGFESNGARALRIDEGTRFWIGPVAQLFTSVLTLQLAEKAAAGNTPTPPLGSQPPPPPLAARLPTSKLAESREESAGSKD